MRGYTGRSCACQSAGIGPPLLWRLPRRSAAGDAALKGLDGMWMRPRGLAAEWLCCLQIKVKQRCQQLEAATLWHGGALRTSFLLICQAIPSHVCTSTPTWHHNLRGTIDRTECPAMCLHRARA